MATMLPPGALTLVTSNGNLYQLGGIYDVRDGRRAKWVEFADAVTYVAGHVCTWANAACTKVTNDISGGSSLGSIVAGVALGVPTTTKKYGFVQVYGVHPTIKTSGADDIAVGESLIVHASTDGACDGVAANATTTASFGTALVADVDADNTVAGFIRC